MGTYTGVDGNIFITGFETVLIFFFTAFVINSIRKIVLAAGQFDRTGI